MLNTQMLKKYFQFQVTAEDCLLQFIMVNTDMIIYPVITKYMVTPIHPLMRWQLKMRKCKERCCIDKKGPLLTKGIVYRFPKIEKFPLNKLVP